MKVCNARGCPELVDQSYCPKHQKVAQARKDARRAGRSPYRALYGTERWKRTSRAQIARDPWCWYCLQRGVRKLATETDHIQPASSHPHLFFVTANHRSACGPCNRAKAGGDA